MEVAEIGAPGGKKVTRSLLCKARQFLIPWLTSCLFCMCRDT